MTLLQREILIYFYVIASVAGMRLQRGDVIVSLFIHYIPGVYPFAQDGHGTGKTEKLAVNFSRQGIHREFSKFNFLHRENCANTGKILEI